MAVNIAFMYGDKINAQEKTFTPSASTPHNFTRL